MSTHVITYPQQRLNEGYFMQLFQTSMNRILELDMSGVTPRKQDVALGPMHITNGTTLKTVTANIGEVDKNKRRSLIIHGAGNSGWNSSFAWISGTVTPKGKLDGNVTLDNGHTVTECTFNNGKLHGNYKQTGKKAPVISNDTIKSPIYTLVGNYAYGMLHGPQQYNDGLGNETVDYFFYGIKIPELLTDFRNNFPSNRKGQSQVAKPTAA